MMKFYNRKPCNIPLNKGDIFILLLLICFTACEIKQFPVMEGDYLGQLPPGDEPELFAEGIVSNGMFNRDFTVSPDGKEIYFGTVLGQNAGFTILKTVQVDGRWQEPVVAEFASDLSIMNLEPFISPDGKRFFFLSNRPDLQSGREEKNEDIWVMDRTESGWSEPYNLGTPINTEGAEFFPSVTLDGTLYFTRKEAGSRVEHIFRSRLVDGKYTEPVKLGPNVNAAPTQFNACIAPDESFLISSMYGMEDSFGGVDYYVSFRDQDDSWSGPYNLGDKINSEAMQEYSPYISPDGKYFFFMSQKIKTENPAEGVLSLSDLIAFHNQAENGNPDIYWVDSEFIEKLRP